MENEKKIDSFERIENFFKSNKKIILIIIAISIFSLVGVSYFSYYKNSENEKISEKFIQAGIYVSLDEREKSKEIYKEIILSKNKFYSLLALNTIIDNDLEENSKEILKLFDTIENIKTEKEQKNLIKLKKALYLIKISQDNLGKKLLDEIISDNSIWKEAASEISKR
tara:strand:- start:1989 stop:2492 length:504 start_codon:yes stop_codon:yes gene_type:complete